MKIVDLGVWRSNEKRSSISGGEKRIVKSQRLRKKNLLFGKKVVQMGKLIQFIKDKERELMEYGMILALITVGIVTLFFVLEKM
jgi:hypothetical protein